MRKSKQDDKLDGIEAFIASKKEGPDRGLSLIGDSTEPNLVRKKVAILIGARRYDEAANFMKDLSPHEIWCDIGLEAYLKAGKTFYADQLFNWIKSNVDDEVIINKCRYVYATIAFDKTFRSRDERMIYPGSLSAEEVENARSILEILKPIVAKVFAQENVINGIESESVQLAILVYYLLQDNQNIINLSMPLFKRIPLPLEAARMVMRGIILDKSICDTIPTRLRIEHNDSFEASLIAVAIECEILKQPKLAFTNIKSISLINRTESEKDEYGKMLFQISQFIDIDDSREALDLSKNIFGLEHKLTIYMNIDILIKEKDYPNAESLLIKVKDDKDIFWLQLYAKYLLDIDRPKDALEYLDKTRAIMPHPELSKTAARIAFEIKNYNLSSEILEQILKTDPENISLINNLATVYFKMGNYVKAAIQYEKLKKNKPDEQSYLFKLASCYTQIGESNQAIQIYEEICRRDEAPLEAFIVKAYLEKIDDPKRAFNTILRLKDAYWENPQYLQAVLELSYASGNEEYGNKALLKIRELQGKGKASQEILQVKTVDDLVAHASQWNEKVKIINQNLLGGKFTWLMADNWQNQTSYMGWSIRTQQADWLMEEPITCASYSIYSTNGFTKYEQSGNTTRLDYIKCPEKGSDIVIDLSALITLQRLDLLDRCIEYFANIYVPQEYQVKLLQDSDRLVIHQYSMKISAEAIKNKITSGRVSILEDIGTPGKRPLPYIREYTLPGKEEEHYYRLIDLVTVAYDSGKLNESKYNILKQIAHEPSGVDSEHSSLKYGDSVLIDLLTLRSICQADVTALDSFLSAFKVFISKHDQILNSNEITQIELQQNIKKWNGDLLKKVKEDIFKKELHVIVPQLEEDDIFLASWELAKGKSLSLLVDDRVLQVLAINTTTIEYPSFGTDSLLMMLFKENMIDIDTLSEAFLKLIKWRYRFIVPSKETLLNFAKRYKNHPPGKDLQEVALYVHDCMRDPGLFAGQENTTLKESMAARLFLSWTRLITEFMVEIWSDSDFNEDNAKLLTQWAVDEFMPSLPKNIGSNGLHIAKIKPNILFNCFYTQTFINNGERTSESLQTLADCINMNETEYFKAVSEVIDIYGI